MLSELHHQIHPAQTLTPIGTNSNYSARGHLILLRQDDRKIIGSRQISLRNQEKSKGSTSESKDKFILNDS
jgi:ABC-type tungstate transport system permease subunit